MPRSARPLPRYVLQVVILSSLSALLATGCASDSADPAESAAATVSTEVDPTAAVATPRETNVPGAGVRVVPPAEAAAHLDNASPVLIDIRTPEEFAAAHLDGATNIDFYAADFADQIDDLSRSEDYVVYCRTGNRSGQTLALMNDLGFEDVADIDGGIVAWEAASFPTVTP